MVDDLPLEDAALVGHRLGVDRLARLEAAQEVLGDREVQADLREVVQRGDARSGRDVGAQRDRAGADAAGEGRPDGQVLEPRLGGLALGLGGGEGAFQGFHLGRQILDLRAGAGAGAVERQGALQLDLDLVAQGDGPVGLGGGLLDLGLALGGVELDQGLPVLTFWPSSKPISLMTPAILAVTVMDSKARIVPTASRISTMRPVLTVSTSTVGGPEGAAPGPGRPGGRTAGRRGHIGADHRHLRQIASLIGIPAAKTRRSQHGDDGELTGRSHACSSKSLTHAVGITGI